MKYYLLKYSFNSSIGGYDENLDIVDITYNRNDLIEYVQDNLDDDEIEYVNDIPFDEFKFDENDNLWKIRYYVDGMTISNECLYKIIEEDR